MYWIMLTSYVFFFKQKTAYEMRISDWSSDVCSSDLGPARAWPARSTCRAPRSTDGRPARSRATTLASGWWPCGSRSPAMLAATCRGSVRSIGGRSGLAGQEGWEEHTSELQSLMRTSYAVFCLKKKNKNTNNRQKT